MAPADEAAPAAIELRHAEAARPLDTSGPLAPLAVGRRELARDQRFLAQLTRTPEAHNVE
jgi:hypothetical protein